MGINSSGWKSELGEVVSHLSASYGPKENQDDT